MKYKIVLDASAVAKWFIREAESIEMRRIRDLYLDDKLELYIPDLLLVELANLLRYAEGLDEKDVVNVVKALTALNINIVDDFKLLEDAVEIAFLKDITVYDGIYVALANKLDAKLLTYDKELLDKFMDTAYKGSKLLETMGL